ncbi:MAG TPA: DUF4381 domain-containing protein [Variovorax sp.]|nr:DUF4381 domain-containing protein [Variovorax sp.]
MTDALVRSSAAPDASLAQLADVVQPPPVPWMPRTPGWEVLGAVLLLGALVLAWRAWRRYLRNRYRRDAMAELKRLQVQWATDDARARAAVLAALAALIKRCALAAWPREQVASINGARWVDFVIAHAGHHGGHGAQVLAPLLRDMQYHGAESLGRISRHDGEVLLAAAGHWIEGHVPA